MHIPDGFLSVPVWGGMAAVSACCVSVSIKKTSEYTDRRDTPLIGMMAAFIFAAQLVNFPVASATSGHLVGGTLLAILFGPWRASLIMTTVVFIQALFFQDGGITAIGANAFNLAFVAPFSGYFIWRLLQRLLRVESNTSSVRCFIAIGLGCWCSSLAAAVAVSLELAASGLVPLRVVILPMVLAHCVAGIFEGVVTAFVIHYLKRNAVLQEKGLGYSYGA